MTNIAELLKILKEEKFETIYTEPIDKRDNFFIFLKYTTGVICTMDTFGDVVNDVSFYCNWLPFSDEKEARFKVHSGKWYGYHGRTIFAGHWDYSGMHTVIHELPAHGTMIVPWLYNPHLFLWHWGDRNFRSSEFESITTERIGKLPKEALEVINGTVN